LAKLQEQRKDFRVRYKSSQDASHIQKKVYRLGKKVTKQKYGIKISTILNAAEKLTADLEYLCSIAESPDPEFPIMDALAYARAVSAVANHLDFVIEDLTENDLSEDEEYVKLSEDDLVLMSSLTESSEEAIKILEKTCGIYLQNN